MGIKDNYLVTVSKDEDNAAETEFNFEKATQAAEFIHTALIHGNNIKVTVKYFPIAETTEG